jgi:hypothetical protein
MQPQNSCLVQRVQSCLVIRSFTSIQASSATLSNEKQARKMLTAVINTVSVFDYEGEHYTTCCAFLSGTGPSMSSKALIPPNEQNIDRLLKVTGGNSTMHTGEGLITKPNVIVQSFKIAICLCLPTMLFARIQILVPVRPGTLRKWFPVEWVAWLHFGVFGPSREFRRDEHAQCRLHVATALPSRCWRKAHARRPMCVPPGGASYVSLAARRALPPPAAAWVGDCDARTAQCVFVPRPRHCISVSGRHRHCLNGPQHPISRSLIPDAAPAPVAVNPAPAQAPSVAALTPAPAPHEPAPSLALGSQKRSVTGASAPAV